MHRNLVLVSVFAAACSGRAEPAQNVGPEPLSGPYLEVQQRLADDSIAGLSQLSARVVTAAEPVQAEPGVSEVIAGAGRLAAQDIDTARLAFEKISRGLILYLKQHPEARGDLEVVFCPMAFNNKGAHWVQTTGDIINPYHGKMMLHCGDKVPWDQAPSM